MPAWIIAIIATSVVATAALTWVLMRINAPPPQPGKRLTGGDAGPHVYGGTGGGPSPQHHNQHHNSHDHDHDAGSGVDSGGDSGGGDGGGD